mgnify:CR=1 FL=1
MVYFTEVATEVAVAGCDYDLPAIVRANGSKEWWTNGRRHRDNGLPAIVRANGTQEYYNNGRKPDIIWTILTFVVNLVLQMLSKLFGLLI